ncbi:hypothetical protein [Chitinophaga solisilvae]|uniref:hypothetical protein n=1 Tax=Chitinophaga solisilvae TaxID=1233460 RepID=UPI00136C19C7|nr:hypothetical protein [Chitinophaga solisilvae]
MMKTPVAGRFLAIYSVIVTIALAMSLMAFRNLHESFEEISVKRINIVDDAGRSRLVISNQEKMPPPVIGGKTYKRAVAPAGLVFYDEKGNECGGIALSANEKLGMRALAFDYSNADAIGLFSREDKDGSNYEAALVINDRGPLDKIGNNQNRIILHTANGKAGLTFNGPDGRARLRIGVDSTGNPVFETLDAKGVVTKRFATAKK